MIPRKLVGNSTECLQSELDLVDIFNVSHLLVSCLLVIPFDHLVDFRKSPFLCDRLQLPCFEFNSL